MSPGLVGLGLATPTQAEGLCSLAEPDCESGGQSGERIDSQSFGDKAGDARVRIVLFWMEGCPRCDEVMNDVLPLLYERYGATLNVRLEEVIGLEGVEKLYRVGERLGLRRDEIGVPIVLIGDHVLTGSDEIARRLPRLVERKMKGEGVDFPMVPEFGIAPTSNSARSDTEQNGRRLVIVGVLAGLGFAVLATVLGIRLYKRENKTFL